MPSGVHHRPRRTWWIIGLCLFIAGFGLALFALAFRSCRFSVEPGHMQTWSLTVRSAPLLPDGKPGLEHSAAYRLNLIGLGPEPSSAAWLVGSAGAAPSNLRLVDVPSDGRIRLRSSDGRLGDYAPQLAGFDFNLLPLPLGAEQEWKPDVVWAALPEGKRTVACSVKRLRSGASPQFRCDFPVSVEWVDPVSGRYRQVRELTATYRFDTLRGVPREALVTFILREEQPTPGGFQARRMTMELSWDGSSSAGDPRDLRDAAAAIAAAEPWLAARRIPPADVLGRLRAAQGPFRSIAAGMLSMRTAQ